MTIYRHASVDGLSSNAFRGSRLRAGCADLRSAQISTDSIDGRTIDV